MSQKIYSKRQVRRAGQQASSVDADPLTRESSIRILNYWREIHCEPLQLAFEDIERLLGAGTHFAIAGRIKKLGTIIDKLKRSDTPSDLDTIYDIAGCRIVVPDLQAQKMLCSKLETLENYNAGKSKNHDYVSRPKLSGYRSRHLIFSYACPKCGHTLSVEIQVRTEYQHAWATAVEMYDMASSSRLKFNELEDPNAVFFRRMSLVIEQLETGGACNTEAVRARYPNLGSLNAAFTAEAVLRAACDANLIIGDIADVGIDDYCLLKLDSGTQTIRIDTHATDEEAVKAYFDAEKKCPDADVVLVKGTSASQIEMLYPNYFGDISQFLGLISKYMPAFA